MWALCYYLQIQTWLLAATCVGATVLKVHSKVRLIYMIYVPMNFIRESLTSHGPYGSPAYSSSWLHGVRSAHT